MTTLSNIVSKSLSKQVQDNQVSNESLLTALAVISSITTAAGLYKGLKDGTIKKGQVGAAVGDSIKATAVDTSLPEYVRSTNHEPRVLVEDSVRQLPVIPKMMMGLVNIYAAYYLQAIALSSTVNSVSVLGVLDKFDPNRKPDLISAVAQEALMQVGYVLPDYTKKHSLNTYNRLTKLALEATSHPTALGVGHQQNGTVPAHQALGGGSGEPEQPAEENNPQQPTAREVSGALRRISDMDSLAVGRMLEVSVTVEGRTINVPMSVRMRPMSVPRLIMNELVSFGDVRQSMKERWHRFRAGELSFAEWMFMTDIIDKKRKLLALDKDGIYREILARKNNAKAAAAMSGQPSIGAASSFIIISRQTARDVELRMGVSIDNDDFRKRMFKENAAMMLLVIDPEWESIYVYTRGISGHAEYTFKEFEGLSKGDGPNIADIMKAYLAGSAPRF